MNLNKIVNTDLNKIVKKELEKGKSTLIKDDGSLAQAIKQLLTKQLNIWKI